MKLRFTMVFDYELPEGQELIDLYGTTDPFECVQIDLDNDPAGVLCESSSELTQVEVVA